MPANSDAQRRLHEMCVAIVCPQGLRPHVRKFISTSGLKGEFRHWAIESSSHSVDSREEP
jgi:preprotein translocase subunit SecB